MTISSTVITWDCIAQILNHRLDSVCRMSLPKLVPFSRGRKKKGMENTPRKHQLLFALLECSCRKGTCLWLQQRQTAWLERALG